MIKALIDLEPTEIIITRHKKVKSSGGFEFEEEILPPQTVRLYYISQSSRGFAFDYRTSQEAEIRQEVLGILADENTDIRAGHDVYDTFEYKGRIYRVVSVNYYNNENIEYHLQAKCIAV